MKVIIHPKYIQLALISNCPKKINKSHFRHLHKHYITGCADHPARWIAPNPSNKAISHHGSPQLPSLQSNRGKIKFCPKVSWAQWHGLPSPSPPFQLSSLPSPHASIDQGIRHMMIAPPGDVCDCSRFTLICRRKKAQWVVSLSLGWLITVPISAYVPAGERYLACWKPKKLKEIGLLLEALKTPLSF